MLIQVPPLDMHPLEKAAKIHVGQYSFHRGDYYKFINYIYFSFAFPFCTTQHQNKILLLIYRPSHAFIALLNAKHTRETLN